MESTLQAEAAMAQQLRAMLTGCGYLQMDQTGWIQVTGADRVRWLNGMLTNSIQSLAPGQGCYNFALNSQGRILGDMNVLAPPSHTEQLLIQTDRVQLPGMMAHLDHFIIMDDVELKDVSEDWHGVLVAGPQSEALLQRIELPVPQEPLGIAQVDRSGSAVTVLYAYSPLAPRYEIWADAATLASLLQEIFPCGTAISPETLESLRVLEGAPRYGVDIRNTEKAHDLPQVTAPQGTVSRALHFAKGCYLGQEIVERIRSRGNVHRAFAGFRLSGPLPQPGTMLQSDGKPAGELTSIARIPTASGDLHVALGYVRREALDRNLPLGYPYGSATPVPLPHRLYEPVQTKE